MPNARDLRKKFATIEAEANGDPKEKKITASSLKSRNYLCICCIKYVLTVSVGVKGWGKCMRSILLNVVIVHGLRLSLDVSDVASVTK